MDSFLKNLGRIEFSLDKRVASEGFAGGLDVFHGWSKSRTFISRVSFRMLLKTSGKSYAATRTPSPPVPPTSRQTLNLSIFPTQKLPRHSLCIPAASNISALMAEAAPGSPSRL